MFVPLTPLSFKTRAARLYAGKLCVVDGDVRCSYAEFDRRTRRLAGALTASGLRPGDRVAYLAYNSAPLLEGYYGVLEAGGVLLPLNIRLTARELTYILNDAEPAFIVVHPDFAALYGTIEPGLRNPPQVVWLGTPPGDRDDVDYELWMSEAPEVVRSPLDVDENDLAELFYTSGTTARPKGVMLTHRNLYLHALGVLIALPASDRDVQLHTIPLFHVNGWGVPQLLTAVGGTHIMMRRFEPAEALRLIETERVTRFYAVPTMITMLLNQPDIGSYDLSSLELVKVGGAPAPAEMIRKAEKLLGCRVVAGYGLSETSPVITLAIDKASLQGQDDAERFRRRAMTGLPLLGVDLEIVDAEGEALPWDGTQRGEIVVRSNVVMSGYWKDPGASEAALRGGWFHTGDIATIDGEGYVSIVDRTKDIIISGGENISSVEVEAALYEHPKVLESAVIAVPDDQWGEVPKAIVALKPGEEATEEELIDFARTKLAGFKAPRSVEFVDSLPKGGTGKIQKARLREKYWQGREKGVH